VCLGQRIQRLFALPRIFRRPTVNGRRTHSMVAQQAVCYAIPAIAVHSSCNRKSGFPIASRCCPCHTDGFGDRQNPRIPAQPIYVDLHRGACNNAILDLVCLRAVYASPYRRNDRGKRLRKWWFSPMEVVGHRQYDLFRLIQKIC